MFRLPRRKRQHAALAGIDEAIDAVSDDAVLRLETEFALRLEMTRVMDVYGRAGVLQASMRACRFEPLPEMRTSSLLGEGELSWEDIV